MNRRNRTQLPESDADRGPAIPFSRNLPEQRRYIDVRVNRGSVPTEESIQDGQQNTKNNYGSTSQQSDTERVNTKVESMPFFTTDIYDEESFVKGKLVNIGLKKMATPNMELPKQEDEDLKLKEIGELAERNILEILEEERKDRSIFCYPVLYFVTAIRHYVQHVCQKITEHPIFESISLLIILANCVILSLDDPTSDLQEEWQVEADITFQVIYTIEIGMKIFAEGLLLNKGAYLRDAWNVLDLSIVVFGYLSYLNVSGGIDLKALRTFRVLRPLRTISSVEGLRILISALVTSLPLLMDTLIILLFFFMIFAIAGLQLWHGILRKRCVNLDTGVLNGDNVCGYDTCDSNSMCAEGFGNPNYGATSFDDIFTALLTVFQCVTMEGWTDTQLYTVRAFGPYAVIFYIPLVLIGAFFLINFTLAVIKSRVSKLYEENRALKKGKNVQVELSPEELQIQAEKKLSVAQLVKAHNSPGAKLRLETSMIFGSEQKKEKKQYHVEILKLTYRRMLGFPDFEKEMEDMEFYEVSTPHRKTVQPIHEDIIREEDENHLDDSDMNVGDNQIKFQSFSNLREKFMNSIKPSLGTPASDFKNSRNASSLFSLKETSKKIELSNLNKKMAIGGMIGIKRPLPPQIKIAFTDNKTLEELDDFTEALFSQEVSYNGNFTLETLKKENKKIPHSERSSSFIDLEESKLPSISKEVTPANGVHVIEVPTPQLTERTPEVTIPDSRLQSARDNVNGSANNEIARRGTGLKEQNTIGTAVSTSVSSVPVIPDSTLKNLGSKFKPPRIINFPSKEDETNITTPDKPERPEIVKKQTEHEFSKGATFQRKQAEEEKELAELNEKIYLTKFILTEGKISISSLFDVQPRKKSDLLPEANLILFAALAPYKVKVRYAPTELPNEEENSEQVNNTNETSKTSSGPGKREETVSKMIENSNPSSARRSSVKGKKKKSRSKSKSKKKAEKVKGKKKTEKSDKVDKTEKGEKSEKGEKPDKANKSRDGDSSQKKGLSQAQLKKAQALLDVPKESGSTVGQKGFTETGSVLESVSSSMRKTEKEGEDDTEKKGEIDASLPVGEIIQKCKEIDIAKTKRDLLWSGQEVLKSLDPYIALNKAEHINSVRLWCHGWKGILKYVRSCTKAIFASEILENLMNLLVMVNTITLAMDRYQQPESESDALNMLNIIFTAIFTTELAGKLFGMGLVKYLSDPLNYLDGAVVIFSLIEIVFLNGQGALSAFRTLRIFRAVRMIRTLRVLRVARLLRGLHSMQQIIEVIGKTIGSFAYIGLLLLILIFIYVLFGMQLFGGKFDFPEGKPRQNYDSFNHAFITMFQVLTMENWQAVLYSCMRCQNAALAAVYLITWIFIGNYILLNLFLAIMLDAFTEVGEEDEENESEESEEGQEKERSGTQSEMPGQAMKMNQTMKTKSQFSKQNSMKGIFDANELTTAAEVDILGSYKALKCNYSLYLFSKENNLRFYCWSISTSDFFEGIVLTLICLGSIKLAVDTYFLNSENDIHTQISFIIDLFFTISFALEALVKIIAFGFMFDKGTYLRDSWNQLDFFIVIASLVDISVTQIDIPMIKILRLFRTFRPLRFVTHNVNMRIIVTALFKSLGAILNTLIVVLVIWMMFSIVGVNFFSGKFQYCTADVYKNSNKEECVANGGDWRTYDHNFDSSVNGLIFLFVLTTQENWPILVYQAIDCTDVEQGPLEGGQWYYGYYFLFFLLIGSMFLLNLFVGVMFLNFSKVQEDESTSFGDITLDKGQLDWIEVQKMIIKAEPDYNVRTVPHQTNWRKPIHQIVTSTYFEVFIAMIILMNMILMAMFYEDASDEYLYALDVINYVFTAIFSVELILKLISFSVNFWYEAWNIFDFIIVFCSYVDIIFSNLGATSLRMLRIGPQLIRVLRVLRVSRLLRLIKKYKRLQDIMEIIQLCLPSMMNVFSLLALVLFIYAVLGCYLFGNVTTGDSINDFYNFSNFSLAMVLCLKMATGEDWNKFMFDCARTDIHCATGMGCGNPIAFIYFLSFKLVITFIMLNLFILIVLQLFDKFFISTDNIVSKYKEDFETFQSAWQSVGPTHAGFFIHQNKLIRFFNNAGNPIGVETNDANEMIQSIIHMRIRSNEEKNVFFNELLYTSIYRAYRAQYSDKPQHPYLLSTEKSSKENILRMADKAAKLGHYGTTRKAFVSNANPFISLMILRLTCRFWKKYNAMHKRKVEDHEKLGELNYKSDKEEDEGEMSAGPSDVNRRMQSQMGSTEGVTRVIVPIPDGNQPTLEGNETKK